MIKDVEKKIDNLVENLRKKHYEVFDVETVEDARKKILELIDENASVGIGGSITIRDIGVIDELIDRGNKVIQHWLPKTFLDEIKSARRRAVRADVYLTSTNAITLDGELVNIDTVGNRVSAMIYGPEKVLIVAGYNKIVKTVDEAVKKIRNETAVKNAGRLGMQAGDLCKVTTIMHSKPSDTDITVILVNQELGF